MQHWWVEAVFSSRERTFIKAPACLFVVQLSSPERSCLLHCLPGKAQEQLSFAVIYSPGAAAVDSVLPPAPPASAAAGCWAQQASLSKFGCTGVVVAVLVREWEVTLWRFGPSSPVFLNVFKQSFAF